MTTIENLSKGFFKENPIFVLMLGLCPTLAVTTSAVNGIAMGLASTTVLLCSNIIVSLIKKLIPDTIRIPSYILIIATFVTIVDLVLGAYFPDVHNALGLFIPLIVVNCVILGRAEAFASKNNLFQSFIDAISMGLGFTLALFFISAFREIFGSGSIFGYYLFGDWWTNIFKADFKPILIFVLPPGAFISMGFLIALMNSFKNKKVLNE
jgi:Na+-translocating ferredoxin:NAD+ oxidoreductase subunit E